MKLISEVYAQGDPIPESPEGVATLVGLEVLFGNALTVIIEIAAIVLFIMLMKGGFFILTSSGNPKQLEAGKKTITYAIMGMLLAASAYFIIQIIEAITGLDLSIFRIRIP